MERGRGEVRTRISMIKMIMRKKGNSLHICDYFKAAVPLSISDGEGVGVRIEE